MTSFWRLEENGMFHSLSCLVRENIFLFIYFFFRLVLFQSHVKVVKVVEKFFINVFRDTNLHVDAVARDTWWYYLNKNKTYCVGTKRRYFVIQIHFFH